MANQGGLPRLYEGETLSTVAGAPTLYKFGRAPGAAPEKPLVVFIPGMNVNARIAYGGHYDYCKEDFLEHWFIQAGFNFLAVSYPMESTPPMMPAVVPAFSLKDWGIQIAEVVKTVLDEQNLSRHIVALAWSAAGRVLEPFAMAAASRGFTIDLYIALAGTPHLPGIFNLDGPRFVISSAGYGISPNLDSFTEQLMASGVKIDEATFRSQYLASCPIALTPRGLHYRDGAFARNEDHNWGPAQHERTIEKFSILPPIAAIAPTTTADRRHAMCDEATWGYLLTYQIFYHIDPFLPKDPERWGKLIRLVQSAPSRLVLSVEGNHFFFAGEKGAKATAEAVIDLIQRSQLFQSEISSLLDKR